MTTYEDLRDYFQRHGYRVIIAADGQTRVSERNKHGIVTKIPAGGVAVALDPVARASHATYIARGRSVEDREALDRGGKLKIEDEHDSYTLKRLFFDEKDINDYYYGFSNQTLWPLCHVTFERPEFHKRWFDGFLKVNQTFAESIKEEIRGKTFIWINDYQLSLVPKLLGKPKDCVVAMFWHIPWPTWEVFRILPFKKAILESILSCDFVGFHRGYHVRNFLDTVAREFEVRIDEETNRVFFNNNTVTVKNLPMGIDTDVIRSLAETKVEEPFFSRIFKQLLGVEEPKKSEGELEKFFRKYKVILGVDRLDYTKGLLLRLSAIDRFFETNREYIGKIVYVGILAPSRESIPLYRELRKDVKVLAHDINKKYAQKNWMPIYLIYDVFPRKDIIKFYQKADLCLVTPRDDGMNLVSKEFVLTSSLSSNPGMLVLSMFAGSAIDLTDALIVNPYDINEVARAIKEGLEMGKGEKVRRIRSMAQTLDERNIYEWAMEFVRNSLSAAKK